MVSVRIWAFLVAAAMTVAGSGGACAIAVGQESAPVSPDAPRAAEPLSLREAVQNLETHEPRPDVESILRRLDKLEQAAAAPFENPDQWTVKFGGHVQLDYINWTNADPAITGPAAEPGTKNYFEFRRLRLMAEGKGYGNLDFRLQMTLEPETVGDSGGAATSPDVKDAYLSMNDIPWLGRFRIGNFFVPFSLEQVTNDTFNVFMERSIPSQGVFAGDREVGVAFYNANENQDFTWTYGAFFDSISDTLKERIDDNQGYRLSGRVTWLPYYDEPSNGRYLVHLGAGVLYTDDQNNTVQFRARPQIHEGPRLIDSGILDATSYTTGNVEAAVVWGPVTVQSEAFLSRVNMSIADPATIGGAYTHVSYFLTGENRKYEPLRPARCSIRPEHSEQNLQPGRRRLGRVGSEGSLVVLEPQRHQRRRVQRPGGRHELVLVRPHTRHVRLDPPRDQFDDDVRFDDVRHPGDAVRLQLVTSHFKTRKAANPQQSPAASKLPLAPPYRLARLRKSTTSGKWSEARRASRVLTRCADSMVMPSQ